MKKVTLKDKSFKTFITADEILKSVHQLAVKINADLKDENPLFLIVLNGSFMFASDLLKKVTIPCEISFIKLASYHGLSSSGLVNELIGLNEDVTDRTVIILEDIVDTGITLEKIHGIVNSRKVKKIITCTLLFKPDSYKKTMKVDYAGISIGNDFVVGYGLDYDGLGRNLEDIYVLDN